MPCEGALRTVSTSVTCACAAASDIQVVVEINPFVDRATFPPPRPTLKARPLASGDNGKVNLTRSKANFAQAAEGPRQRPAAPGEGPAPPCVHLDRMRFWDLLAQSAVEGVHVRVRGRSSAVTRIDGVEHGAARGGGRAWAVGVCLVMVLCAGWGFAPSQAARPTRLPLAAEACRLVPGTDACVPIDAVAADAVRRSRDKELADLYFAVAACSGKTEADTCKADGRCVWDSASCLCSVREIMENLPLCYDLPDPEYSSAASECPSAKSKRQCRQVGPCRWKRGRCHAKPLKKVDAEDKPRVCELQSRIGASHSVECALHATEEECEGTNGTCFWGERLQPEWMRWMVFPR
ncbi:unnamed protein product [Ostreobium quekettii]|uniref:Uncharacterized protein n=1 Tax=Ostreobium quekettii TaxID=121088 RepID=A0A8S1J4D2_9CHLO|nr:unnamed protein product [Ostreobium quekettii]